MSTYEALMLMCTFGMLIIAILGFNSVTHSANATFVLFATL